MTMNRIVYTALVGLILRAIPARADLYILRDVWAADLALLD